MHPRHAPRTPRAEIFIHVSSPTIPAAWRRTYRGGVGGPRVRRAHAPGATTSGVADRACTGAGGARAEERPPPQQRVLDALAQALLAAHSTGRTRRRVPEGQGPAAVRRWSGLDSAKRVQPLSDLAAGHLQGPARTVSQVRTTSFLWSRRVANARMTVTRRPARRRSAGASLGLGRRPRMRPRTALALVRRRTTLVGVLLVAVSTTSATALTVSSSLRFISRTPWEARP